MGISQSILDLNAARPFVPYEIKMVSGEKYHVPHPEFVGVLSRRDAVAIWTPDNRKRTLNALLIEWVGSDSFANNRNVSA
jgi:hypothetical protein